MVTHYIAIEDTPGNRLLAVLYSVTWELSEPPLDDKPTLCLTSPGRQIQKAFQNAFQKPPESDTTRWLWLIEHMQTLGFTNVYYHR